MNLTAHYLPETSALLLLVLTVSLNRNVRKHHRKKDICKSRGLLGSVLVIRLFHEAQRGRMNLPTKLEYLLTLASGIVSLNHKETTMGKKEHVYKGGGQLGNEGKSNVTFSIVNRKLFDSLQRYCVQECLLSDQGMRGRG